MKSKSLSFGHMTLYAVTHPFSLLSQTVFLLRHVSGQTGLGVFSDCPKLTHASGLVNLTLPDPCFPGFFSSSRSQFKCCFLQETDLNHHPQGSPSS